MENTIVLEYIEADRHYKESFGENSKRPEELWGEETKAVVEKRAEEVKRVREWVL